MAPDTDVALGRSGRDRHPGGERSEPHLPFVAPHLPVDVDHVVVGDRDPGDRVADRECAVLVRGPIVPHDPDPSAQVAHSKGPVRRRAAQVGAAPGLVAPLTLRDGDAGDGLAGPERDLPVRPLEGAVEVVGDALGDDHRSVRGDVDQHIGLGKGEGLGQRRERQCQRQEHCGGQRHGAGDARAAPSRHVGQNWTRGASSAASGASKNSRTLNPVSEATMLDGTVCTRLLKVSTVSL